MQRDNNEQARRPRPQPGRARPHTVPPPTYYGVVPWRATNVITGTGDALLEVGPELYNTLKIIDCRNQKINEVLKHLGQ